MPTKPRCRNSIPAAAKPRKPTCGPTANAPATRHFHHPWRSYRSNDLQPGPKIIVFDYQAGRSGRYAGQFLQNWQGHLIVDDYGGYKALFAAARARPETGRQLN